MTPCLSVKAIDVSSDFTATVFMVRVVSKKLVSLRSAVETLRLEMQVSIRSPSLFIEAQSLRS